MVEEAGESIPELRGVGFYYYFIIKTQHPPVPLHTLIGNTSSKCRYMNTIIKIKKVYVMKRLMTCIIHAHVSVSTHTYR